MYTIYSKLNCPNCDIAKAQLMLRGLKYVEVLLDTPEKLADFKSKFPTIRAVPYVVLDDVAVGGLTAFKTHLRSLP